jgi:hypothetical protein
MDVEEARLCFASSLVGRWSTAQGTFASVMDQHWEIRSDGTGCFTDTGPFGHPRAETWFEWRQVEPFDVEMRLTRFVSFDPEDAEVLDDEDTAWRRIRYDFVEVRTDCGVEVGLIEVGRKAFFESQAPLAYRGPASASTAPPGSRA